MTETAFGLLVLAVGAILAVGGATVASFVVVWLQSLSETIRTFQRSQQRLVDRRMARWDAAATTVDMTRADGTLQGEIDGFACTISQPQRGVRVQLDLGREAKLQMARRSMPHPPSGAGTGDEDFDRAFVHAADATTRHWLSAPVRRCLIDRDLRIAALEQRVILMWPERIGPEETTALVEEAHGLVRAMGLARPASEQRQALIDDLTEPARYRADLIDDARKGHDPIDPRHLRDPSLLVQRAAAEALGEHAHLLTLATRSSSPREVRRRATEGLARADHPGAAIALTQLFDSDDPELRTMGVDVARRVAASGIGEALLGLHTRGHLLGSDAASLQLTMGVGRAAQRQGDRRLEPLLLEMLTHSQPGVVHAAVLGLQTCGSAPAVPALRGVLDELGLLSPLRTEVDRAIDAIQGRAKGSAGGLAIAEAAPEVGAVSVAGGPGELSLAPGVSGPEAAASGSPRT